MLTELYITSVIVRSIDILDPVAIPEQTNTNPYPPQANQHEAASHRMLMFNP